MSDRSVVRPVPGAVRSTIPGARSTRQAERELALTRKRMWAGLALVAWFAQAAYILFPFDLLPDFIPLIGWVDDLLGLVGLITTTVWMVRAVREVGFAALVGLEPGRLVGGGSNEPAVYEPIPPEVLRTL